MKKVAIITISLLLICATGSAASILRVHFIAVGHGDAILIEKDGQAALVDAGPAKTGASVLEYLRSNGIKHLQHVFATHTHQDHIGALPMILDSLRVDTVHVTGMVDEGEEAQDLTRHLQSGKWVVDTTDIGDTLMRSDDFNVVVLSPPSAETAGKTVDYNGNSMVLMLTHKRVKILLAADINRDRENWLMERYGATLAAQVLKSPHHGSAFGNSEEFLKAVKPQLTVISTGPSGWGYPAEETVQRLKKFCPKVLRTDQEGTVVIQSNGKKVSIISSKDNRP